MKNRLSVYVALVASTGASANVYNAYKLTVFYQIELKVIYMYIYITSVLP